MTAIFDTLSAFSVALRDLFASLVSLKGLLSILALVPLSVAGVTYLDWQADYLFFRRYSEKLAAFEKLQGLQPKNTTPNEQLADVDDSLVSDLLGHNIVHQNPIQTPSINLSADFGQGFWKFISGSAIGLLMMLYAILSKGEDNRRSLFFGALLYSVVVGSAFSFLPIIWFPWVNYLVLPWIPVLALFLIQKLRS